MLSFKELDIFYRLCKNPHVSKLTKEVGLTQSAISISLNSLEKKLGEKLFDRIGKKLILNERGKLFYKSTFLHFDNLQKAQEQFMDNPLSGELIIAGSKTFNSMDLSLFIYDFSKDHNVHITKYVKNTKFILDALQNSQLDIGFVESDFELSNLHKEKIAQDRLIIVTADKTLENKEFYIDQLYSKKWILREKGSATREVFLNKLKYLDEFQIAMEISNFEEIKNILLHNKETITCISKLAVKKEIEEKRLFEVKTKNLEFKRELFMVYHKDKYRSKLLDEFTSYIKECFAKL